MVLCSCEIIKDKVTKKSLCYAFVEFESKEVCEQAYLKMENVLIDDKRIHVDFSQSVSKYGRNITFFGTNRLFKTLQALTATIIYSLDPQHQTSRLLKSKINILATHLLKGFLLFCFNFFY